MSEIYLNNISVISYNNISYTVSEIPEVYGVNNLQLVSADNSIDYLSPPWMSNMWSYIYYDEWQYNGRNVLKNQINYQYSSQNDQVSCGYLTSNIDYTHQQIFQHGYVWNRAPIVKTNDIEIIPNKTYYIYKSTGGDNTKIYYSVLNPTQSELNNYYETSGNYFNGTIYMNIKSPSGFDQNGNIIQIDNILRGNFTKIDNTNRVSGYIEGLVNFHNHEILVGGILEGKLNNTINGEEIITDKINNNIKDSNNKILSGTIYQIWNLSGIIQNINPIPYEIQMNLNNYKAFGWLNGFDNLAYSNKFIENEISGYVSCKGKNKLPTQIFEGDIEIIVPTSTNNIIKGHITKLKQSSIVTGQLDGDVLINDENIHMLGNFTGKVNLNSRMNKFINKEMYTIMNLSWISGTLYNTQQLSNSIRKIIDIKNYNTLGRKGLIYQNSLYGNNLNKTSKNYDINNRPYMVQTWKIIKYDYDNNSRITPLYNQNIIDLKTHLANSEQVRNKQAYTQKYIEQPLTSAIGNYFCEWKQINSDIVISILSRRAYNRSNKLFSRSL